MASEVIKLDMVKDVAPRLTLTVRFVGMREMSIRLWIARQLLKVAAWVTNMDIKFEEKPWDRAD